MRKGNIHGLKIKCPVHWFEAQNRNEIYNAVKEWLVDEDK